MKRLTKLVDGEIQENHDYDASAEDFRSGSNRFRNGSRAIREKLARYEDIGLEPEEVAELVQKSEERSFDDFSPIYDETRLICWNRQKRIGERHDFADQSELFAAMAGRIGERYEAKDLEDERLAVEILRKRYGMLPVYANSRGAIVIEYPKTGAEYKDRVQIGWIYVEYPQGTEKKKSVREYVERCLHKEIEALQKENTVSIR